jgi:Tol biopolymer transport system component
MSTHLFGTMKLFLIIFSALTGYPVLCLACNLLTIWLICLKPALTLSANPTKTACIMNKRNCPVLRARASLFTLGALATTFIFWLILPLSASPAPLQLLSVRNSSVSQPAGGNGNSVAPQISPDGRFVLFTSSASDLVSGDNGLFTLDVFLRDRASNTTVLVSANVNSKGGGNGNSMFGMVSTNGRYVVFQSDASDLVLGDTNGVSDIFRRDLVAGTTALVNVAINGGFANGASTDPIMTPDGRYVVFLSAATNLVANDTNGIPDVFVSDMVSNTTTLVSVGASGANSVVATPVISPDGRYVAFFSSAKNLAIGVPGASPGEVYVRDLVANTTKWASTNAIATAAIILHFNISPSYHPALSDDGRFVAFKTGWTNGSAAPGGASIAAVLVFRYDSASGSSSLLTTNGFAPWAYNDDTYGPEMTPDGRFIVFVATNRAFLNTSVNLWDAQTGTNAIVSVALDGGVPTNSFSYAPSLSPDGRYVLFLSNATNLVNSVTSSGYHIYLRDVQAGSTQLIDADTNGAASTDELGTVPGLSADGRFVAFCSLDGGLVASDNNNAFDVFLRVVAGGATELISQRSPAAGAQSGNALSSLAQNSLSADGRWVAFASYAKDLVTNDFNNDRDVFVSDLLTGSNLLVSVGMDGNSALGGSSVTPVISADGRFVAFVSAATNLVSLDTNGAADIFLRDLQAGITTLVSVNTSGVSLGTGDSSAPVISQDGRYVAFLCKTNTSVPYPGTFRRDMIAGTTISLAGASAIGPSMSADGQRVAYFDGASHLYVWDAQLSANIYTNPAIITSASLAPTGNRLLYHNQTAKQLIVLDLLGSSNLFSCTNTTPIKSASPWSSDGRFVAFVTGAVISSGDSNGTNDVFLCDLQTGVVTLISANQSWTGSASGVSDSPAMSGDGRFVAFRSFATNIVLGITNFPSLFVFDRSTGSNTVVATGAPGSWTFWTSQPVINGNGASVVFQSWDSGLLAGDLNRVQDVFAQSQGALVVDSDGDGIPDWWMVKYFGHPTGQAGDNSRAQDDADGDGMTNLQEYLTATDPTNSNSVFSIQISIVAVSGNNVLLTWPAVPGKSYLVQYKDELSSPTWLNFSGGVAVVAHQGSITILASQASRSYRVICVN